MADNDIYNNEKKYRDFVNNLDSYLVSPEIAGNRLRKYWIKNKANKIYFKELFKKFEAKDLSYIRRLRLLRTFLMICHVITKDLKNVKERSEIDEVMAFAHQRNKSIKTKQDFAIDIKYLWKTVFPEIDERGRIDDTIMPYVVRHISTKIDKSKEKLRGDKFSVEEFEKLVQSFSNDPRMQCLLTVTLESLTRPQEILERKNKNVEIHDNYAKIYISEHGKEGVGFLRCIDSYFYLTKWYNQHPLKDDPEAYLFVNTGKVNRYKQLNPSAVNKLIRDKCKKLNIKKPITLYSLKRNGITMMRLSGASDLDIQHTARWTSTKQLKTYDLSNQEESFKIELIKRGKIAASKQYEQFKPKTKECPFCKQENGITETICYKCQRPLDRTLIEKEAQQREHEIQNMKLELEQFKENMFKTIQQLTKQGQPEIAANIIHEQKLIKELKQKAKT